MNVLHNFASTFVFTQVTAVYRLTWARSVHIHMHCLHLSPKVALSLTGQWFSVHWIYVHDNKYKAIRALSLHHHACVCSPWCYSEVIPMQWPYFSLMLRNTEVYWTGQKWAWLLQRKKLHLSEEEREVEEEWRGRQRDSFLAVDAQHLVRWILQTCSATAHCYWSWNMVYMAQHTGRFTVAFTTSLLCTSVSFRADKNLTKKIKLKSRARLDWPKQWQCETELSLLNVGLLLLSTHFYYLHLYLCVWLLCSTDENAKQMFIVRLAHCCCCNDSLFIVKQRAEELSAAAVSSSLMFCLQCLGTEHFCDDTLSFNSYFSLCRNWMSLLLKLLSPLLFIVLHVFDFSDLNTGTSILFLLACWKVFFVYCIKCSGLINSFIFLTAIYFQRWGHNIFFYAVLLATANESHLLFRLFTAQPVRIYYI